MGAEVLREEKKILETVRSNLNKLMTAHGFTYEGLCDYLKSKGELSVNRSTFSRFMSRQTSKPNLAFLVSCSHVFEIPLDHLISEDFDPNENFQKIREKYKSISSKSTDAAGFEFLPNEIFITDPDSPLWQKYMQSYFCYYYSTVSAENNTDNIQESLISGQLNIEAKDGKCKATLKIDTKKTDRDGNPTFKIYSGDAILCPSIQSVHCILALPEGEFCFIIFRYSHLNVNMQDCRMAQVLSTSSTADKRYPVIHRMLLSREEICIHDLDLIASHLCLNSREILISKEELLSLANASDNHKQIVTQILQQDSEQMYCISENTVKEICKNYLSPEKFSVFIAELRAHSFASRYNKVGMTVDEEIHTALCERGYFQENASRTYT